MHTEPESAPADAVGLATAFAGRLDDLSRWRATLLDRLASLQGFLDGHDLACAASAAVIGALRERLASDKVVAAFVAEFSRGKSELINAIFFADTGRRVLPATPGRTTMCPVELSCRPGEPASLALLPIETRHDGATLAELRARPNAWTRLPLQGGAAEQLSEAVAQVMRTRRVDEAEARALGLRDDERSADAPTPDADGQVEIPVWRHALVNYPHPLLERGLVVLDTPGLNALGAEPELTLGLLPEAQATVFVLGADTGVTRSDMQLWQEHLGARAKSCFVVLNKIDTLRDPLSAPAQVANQIESLRRATARTLGVAPERVFALSAREALTARIQRDDAALRASRLPAFEAALGAQLLGQRHAVLQDAVAEAARQLQSQVARRGGERRRQSAEQVQELRSLRGKSANQLRAAQERAAAEAAEFEQCNVLVQALRAVHLRLLTKALAGLASDALRSEVQRMQQEMNDSLLGLGARKAFTALCERLRARLAAAQDQCAEIHAMLRASHARLNAEYAFGLSLEDPPALQRFVRELAAIESGYTRYLGFTHALRLAQPRFMDSFVRMLVSKLRVVFESAAAEVEAWSKSAASHLDAQLGERRRAFRRRAEALARIRVAAGELEQRLAELGAQDAALAAALQRAGNRIEALQALAPQAPAPDAPTAAAARPGPTAPAAVRRPRMTLPRPLGARA
ncbi:MAG TPA: dynamin family protein [Burkholderiaceae bacterium]|nr:dynamin family protein [Burkholderiaceae bacterium]